MYDKSLLETLSYHSFYGMSSIFLYILAGRLGFEPRSVDLESTCLPLAIALYKNWRSRLDLNQRKMDLQSTALDHSATRPKTKHHKKMVFLVAMFIQYK